MPQGVLPYPCQVWNPLWLCIKKCEWLFLCTLLCTYYDIPERSELYVDAFHLQKDIILKNGTCVVIYTRTCALCRLCESVLLFLFVVFCQAVLLKYLERIKTTDVKRGGDRSYLLRLSSVFFCCCYAPTVCTEIKYIHNLT